MDGVNCISCGEPVSYITGQPTYCPNCATTTREKQMKLTIAENLMFRSYRAKVVLTEYSASRETCKYGLSVIGQVSNQVIARVTVNLPSQPVGEHDVFVKDREQGVDLLEFLTLAGLVRDTGISVSKGNAAYSVATLTPKVINQIHAAEAA